MEVDLSDRGRKSLLLDTLAANPDMFYYYRHHQYRRPNAATRMTRKKKSLLSRYEGSKKSPTGERKKGLSAHALPECIGGHYGTHDLMIILFDHFYENIIESWSKLDPYLITHQNICKRSNAYWIFKPIRVTAPTKEVRLKTFGR